MRRSPLHAWHEARAEAWCTLNGMQMPLRLRSEAEAGGIRIADVSHGVRVGLKGPAAGAWLGTRGVPVPLRPNSWIATPGHALVARLGEGEFLIEDFVPAGLPAALAAELAAPPAGVYPVLRQDVSLLLWGEAVDELLLETCSLDFRELKPVRCSLALTSMAGVAVLVVPVPGAVPAYRIWADPSYGPYLWETLLEVAESHGGAAAGWARADASRLL